VPALGRGQAVRAGAGARQHQPAQIDGQEQALRLGQARGEGDAAARRAVDHHLALAASHPAGHRGQEALHVRAPQEETSERRQPALDAGVVEGAIDRFENVETHGSSLAHDGKTNRLWSSRPKA